MTPGNIELVDILVSWSVSLPAVIFVIRRDERRLEGDRLARAWPPVSRDAAIFNLWMLGLPHLALLVHFVKTRWSALGVGLGLVWLALVFGADLGAQWVVEQAIAALGL